MLYQVAISHVSEVFSYNLFKYLIRLFLLFFWGSYNLKVGAFLVIPEVFGTVLISFHSFVLYSVLQQWFPPLSSNLLIHSSPSVIILLVSSSVFFISVCLFFKCSISLLDIAFIFFMCASNFSLRFWIIFTLTILNYFSGRLPKSFSVSCSCRSLSYYFIWKIFLCCLFLCNFLWLWSSFQGFWVVFPLVSGVCSLVDEVGSGIVQAFWC